MSEQISSKLVTYAAFLVTLGIVGIGNIGRAMGGETDAVFCESLCVCTSCEKLIHCHRRG